MSKKRTYKERLDAGLVMAGFKWHEKRRGWTKVEGEYIFVGPNGGLRAGRCKTQSRSIGDSQHQTEVYKHLLKLGDKRLDEGAPTMAQQLAQMLS